MIYLVDADSSIPNIALMRLATYFRARGETVRLVRPQPEGLSSRLQRGVLDKGQRRQLFDPPGRVLGSSIFRFAAASREALEREWGAWGPILWGGTGVRLESSLAEIDASIDWDAVALDYSLYPEFTASLGFLTRGCRLRCGFCVVPQKEGRPRAVASVHDVWRGAPHPRHLLLLDNDAFAKPLASHWIDAVREMRERKFKVCFSQGLNVRLITDESAAAVASLSYTGHDFSKKRLFTAWDTLGDERIFRRGVDTLARAGIPASHLRVYMLIGYDPAETWEAIFYRITELIALGCDPFPMVFDKPARPDLCSFARWAHRHLYRNGRVPWPAYRHGTPLTPDARAASDAAWQSVASGWKPPRRVHLTDNDAAQDAAS